MKLAPVLAIAVILSVLPRPGLGQDRSSVEMFGGVSYLRATDHLRYPSGEINTFGLDFAATAYVTPRLGVTAEFGAHHGWRKLSFPDVERFRTERTTLSYLFGPHIRLINTDRLVVAARALLGVTRGEFVSPVMLPDQSGFTTIRSWGNHFTGAFGGTIDLRLSQRLAWRVAQPDVFVMRFGSRTQTDFRIATGIVVRFGRK